MERQAGKLIIAKRYSVSERLGEGGFGEVFRVRDLYRGGQVLALKTIKEKFINNEFVKEFKNEFDIMTRLRHPNLMRVYDFGQSRTSQFYITMEYVPGITLGQFLRETHAFAHGPAAKSMQSLYDRLRQEDLPNLFVKLARCLNFIHSRGILHRDIKPANIMYGSAGLKIMDFGLSELYKKKRGSLRDAPSQVKGTFPYMAPELLYGQADERFDIYSLGMVFYELLTGKKFCLAADSRDVIAFLSLQPRFNQQRDHALACIEDANMRGLVSRMTMYDPTERFQSCTDVILAINHSCGRAFAVETPATKMAYVLGAGFVNRTQELHTLHACLGDGQQKLHVVTGAPGIGKSRLIYEFKKRCQLQGTTFLQADCLTDDQGPFSSVMPIVVSLLFHVPDTFIADQGPELKKLLPLHPLLAKAKAAPFHDAESERNLMVHVLVEVIRVAVAQQQAPVVLYFNDLHWADDGTLAVIKDLLYQLNQPGAAVSLTLYASTREGGDAFQDFIRQLKDLGRMQEITLKPFSAEHVGQYIEAVFGSILAPSLIQEIPSIKEMVGGNPLFLQEWLKTLVFEGVISRGQHFWQVTRPINTVAAPENLRALLSAHLDKLSLPAHQVQWLFLLSLMHRGISIDIFSQLLQESSRDELLQFIQFLEAREIIVAEAVDAGLAFRFSHKLLNDVVEASIPKGVKTALHQRIADGLERIYAGNLQEHSQELAYHYTRTEQTAKALRYLLMAAEHAAKLYDNERAIAYFRDYLSLYDQQDMLPYIETQRKLGIVLSTVGEWQQAMELFENNIDLARDLDNRMYALSMVDLGSLLRRQGKYDEAYALLRPARDLYKRLGNKQYEANTVSNIGLIYFNKGQFEKAMAAFRFQLKISQALDCRNSISVAWNNMGNIYARTGRYQQAIKAYQHAIDVIIDDSYMDLTADTLSNMGNVHFMQGRYDEAMHYYQQALAYARKVGNKGFIGLVTSHIALIYNNLGQYEQAKKHFSLQADISLELGMESDYSLAIGNIGLVYYRQGNLDKAMECYHKQLDIARALGLTYHIAIASSNIGTLLRDQGNFSEAMRYYEQQYQLGEELGDPAVYSVAMSDIAELLRATDPEQAMRYFQRAVAIQRELGLRFYLADSLVNLAELLLDLEQVRQAESLITETEQIAAQLKRENILFRCRLLSARIAGQANSSQGVYLLHGLLSRYNRPPERALLFHELFRLTKQQEFQKKAEILAQQTGPEDQTWVWLLRRVGLEGPPGTSA